ncbi:retrovirus-related pol polyprotein from transposon TNT 1-94, partial [Tanacetum coccineum]
KQCAEIEKKNLLIENENLIVNCLSTQLLYDVEKSRCLDLEADMSKVHDESKLISKLERKYLNLQLKYQHLQESFDNKNSQASQEAPDFNSFFKIKNLEHQIKEKDNVIRHLKDLVASVNDRSREPYNAVDVTALIEQNDCDRVELEKVKQHYKELYDSIKITRAHTSEKTSTMLNEIESLKAQLRSKEPCFTSDYVKPKVLAPGMYAIDVKPIPHPLKNNRSAHLNYISHLKESVETVREIVEEARVVKPLDSSLNYACRYTKLSQELLECVIGTCPKSFNERDNKAPSTPVTRKKQVTFSDKPGTSSSNTQKHKVHQRVQLTNIPVLPSTGVNDSTEASGSKPRSNTKKNRILPAKKENKKEVEVRLRTNKSYRSMLLYLELRLLKPYDGKSLKAHEFVKSSSGQFCDSDLEVAFRKHTCFVRDINGTDILKGSRSTNLYTISMDEMMKSSPIKLYCLTASMSKSCPCQLGKSKKFSHRPKSENTNMEVLHTLHMDLCGPMRVQSINGKKYILVIVDDYSRFTWVKFLRSKDETPEFVTNFLKQIQVGLNKTVRFIRTDNGTEFVNQVMSEYYEGVGIFHQTSVPRTPQQNGVVERRNRTLVEAARTMMIFSKAPMGSRAKLKGYRIYNKRTRQLMETIHVTIDEMHQSMAPVRMIPSATEVNAQVAPLGTSLSTTMAQDASSTSASSSTSDMHHPVRHQGITEELTHEDSPINHNVLHPLLNPVTEEPGSAHSSSGNVNSVEPYQVNQPPDHL